MSLHHIASSVINFKFYLRSSSQAMADKEKREEGKNTKNLNISRTKIAF